MLYNWVNNILNVEVLQQFVEGVEDDDDVDVDDIQLFDQLDPHLDRNNILNDQQILFPINVRISNK